MVVDPDTVKSCLLAANDERGEVRQGPTDRNSERDPDPSHPDDTSSFPSPISTIQSLVRHENKPNAFMQPTSRAKSRYVRNA
jgi:hypothetical protein